MEDSFSHLDNENRPQMVDVGDKKITQREAVAQSAVKLPQSVLDQFEQGDIQTKKGAVFQTAILAGIMGAKKTSDLIPLCHPLPINKVSVDIELEADQAIITARVKTEGKTGVEMEALTAASVAALTIYDMCKAFSHDIIIRETKLLAKSGGKRDFQR